MVASGPLTVAISMSRCASNRPIWMLCGVRTGGNTYEIAFIKAGYEVATRRVAVNGTSDRKIAVALRKRPPPKRTSFFHPHR